jgi:hypothetical protein
MKQFCCNFDHYPVIYYFSYIAIAISAPKVTGVETNASEQSRVTVRLTVSQSVSLGVEPNLGLLTRDIFFLSYGLVL